MGEFFRPEQLLLYLMHSEDLDVNIEMENTPVIPLNEAAAEEQL